MRLVLQEPCIHGEYDVLLTHNSFHLNESGWVKCDGSKETLIETKDMVDAVERWLKDPPDSINDTYDSLGKYLSAT